MKKLAIAGASVALAAMPVMGVFADPAQNNDGNAQAVDEVSVTVSSACSLATSGTALNSETYIRQYSSDIVAGGAAVTITGSTLTVTCNDAGGWEISAVGNGDATNKTTMHLSGAAAGTQGDDIVTGTTFSETAVTTSNWAFRVSSVDDNGTAFTAGYGGTSGSADVWAQIPASATVIAHHKDAVSVDSADLDNITMSYKVQVASTQKTGTYTGKVLYTLAHPDSYTPGV